MDQNNSEYGYVLRSAVLNIFGKLSGKCPYDKVSVYLRRTKALAQIVKRIYGCII